MKPKRHRTNASEEAAARVSTPKPPIPNFQQSIQGFPVDTVQKIDIKALPSLELSKRLKHRSCECSDWSICLTSSSIGDRMVECLRSCGKKLKQSCYQRQGLCSNCYSFTVAERNAKLPAELKRQKEEGHVDDCIQVRLTASPKSYRDALVTPLSKESNDDITSEISRWGIKSQQLQLFRPHKLYHQQKP